MLSLLDGVDDCSELEEISLLNVSELLGSDTEEVAELSDELPLLSGTDELEEISVLDWLLGSELG